VKFHPCLRYGDGSHYHPYASLFIHSLGFHSNSNLSLFSSVPPSLCSQSHTGMSSLSLNELPCLLALSMAFMQVKKEKSLCQKHGYYDLSYSII